MQGIDYLVIILFFMVLLGTGVWSCFRKVKDSGLFFVAGVTMLVVVLNFLSYNGGTWNLATRFISQPSGESVRKSARLSAMLYLLWPLVLFFPMWCTPLFFPGLENPEAS